MALAVHIQSNILTLLNTPLTTPLTAPSHAPNHALPRIQLGNYYIDAGVCYIWHSQYIYSPPSSHS